MAYVLEHTRLGFCWLDLIALAVLVLVVVIFVRKRRAMIQEEEELDYGDGVRPRSDGERKSEDYYTVLILGRDTGGGGNTDTMLLASYDVTNQKATVMSIPRDTMVNVPWDIKKINSVYPYYGGGDRGIQYLYKEISQLVGFEPDFQVIVEWEAVGQIVDAMDGVWFDVPRDMDYEDPYQDLSIHLDKGYQLLNGEQAMGVVRFRDGVNGSFLDSHVSRIQLLRLDGNKVIWSLEPEALRFFFTSSGSASSVVFSFTYASTTPSGLSSFVFASRPKMLSLILSAVF